LLLSDWLLILHVKKVNVVGRAKGGIQFPPPFFFFSFSQDEAVTLPLTLFGPVAVVGEGAPSAKWKMKGPLAGGDESRAWWEGGCVRVGRGGETHGALSAFSSWNNGTRCFGKTIMCSVALCRRRRRRE
jgi:hypothetical protein